MKEIWKDVKDYEGLYKISNLGNVYSVKADKMLKPRKDKYGYIRITIWKNSKSKTVFIHQLIAQAFLENPNNYDCINHKDENKTNNVVSNLEWCTRGYNNTYSSGKHRIRHTKINQYDLNGNFIKTWNNKAKIHSELGISVNSIYNCCKHFQKSVGGYKWEYAK